MFMMKYLELPQIDDYFDFDYDFGQKTLTNDRPTCPEDLEDLYNL